MEIVFKKAFKFDLDHSVVLPMPIPNEDSDFSHYLNDLIEEVIGDVRSKKFLFPIDETAIMTAIQNVRIEELVEQACLDTANRLLRTEAFAQQQIEHLDREIQRGVLFQALVEDDTQFYFIVAKAEHLDYIDEQNSQRSKGLPIKKKIFKSFCAYLNNEGSPLYAKVGDSGARISTYWWHNFLELIEEHNDSYNTIKSFEALDKKIFDKLKRDFREDYMYLRNATVQYFRSREEFVLEDYVNEIFVPYVPEKEDLDIAVWGNHVRRLPESQNFDSRFTIIKSDLKKRIIKKIKLTPQLVLEIKEDIDWNTVRATIIDNEKYIQIRSDEGFDYFKKD